MQAGTLLLQGTIEGIEKAAADSAPGRCVFHFSQKHAAFLRNMPTLGRLVPPLLEFYHAVCCLTLRVVLLSAETWGAGPGLHQWWPGDRGVTYEAQCLLAAAAVRMALLAGCS